MPADDDTSRRAAAEQSTDQHAAPTERAPGARQPPAAQPAAPSYVDPLTAPLTKLVATMRST